MNGNRVPMPPARRTSKVSFTLTEVAMAILVLLVGLLAACGTAIKPGPTDPSDTAPLSLTITDTPPTGVTVLAFEITITGAVLQPGNVSLISAPVTFETQRLLTGPALLSTTNVAAGTYTSITFTVANPSLTVLNGSGSTINGCANETVCQFKPSISPVQVSLSAGPLPLTITKGTPVGLQADVNLNKIVQSDLSLVLNSSAITMTQLPSVPFAGLLTTIDDLLGQVTALGVNQFTVQDAVSGQSFSISVGGSTVFEGFDQIGCAVMPQNFSCLKVGQIVSVDANLLGSGTLLATVVMAEDDVSLQDIEGFAVAVNPISSQLQMVVLGESPTVPGISVGDLVNVNILQPTGLQFDRDDLPLPFNFSFQTTQDLLVGQEIQAQVAKVFLGPSGSTVVDASRIRLRSSQFTAKVASTGSSNFTLGTLPSVFTNASIAQIQVLTSSASALMAGDTVSLRGLLFNNSGAATLVTEKIRKR